MATKNQLDAAAADTPDTPADTVVAPRARTSGLLLGGVIASSLLVGGLLFGGGVLVGAHIGHGGPQLVQSFGPGQGGPGGILESGPRPDGLFGSQQREDRGPRDQQQAPHQQAPDELAPGDETESD